MENVEKLRVLLQHWIEHNKGHGEEFAKWQKRMAEDSNKVIADCIGEAIEQMGKVNDQLAKALNEAGGPVEKTGGGEHHHHHHGDDGGHHHH
ncbi:MAG: hypothetical protein JRJ68_03140 [Deltaproteobacteria bacterium]|nr:hypothetical protein [Deltaproteobacteria bacterium]